MVVNPALILRSELEQHSRVLQGSFGSLVSVIILGLSRSLALLQGEFFPRGLDCHHFGPRYSGFPDRCPTCFLGLLQISKGVDDVLRGIAGFDFVEQGETASEFPCPDFLLSLG